MVTTEKKLSFMVSIIILALLLVAAEAFPLSLIELAEEDGIAENSTAFLFFLSGLIFLWSAHSARKSGWKKGSYATYFLVAWGVMLVVFAGEEISWGQRIIGFETPEVIKNANKQDEFTFHNLDFLAAYGGTGIFLTMIMLVVGLLLPILDRASPAIDRIGIPVPSLACCILFVGSFLYSEYFKLFPANVTPELQGTFFFRTLEIRELILSMATLCFAVGMSRRVASAAPQGVAAPG